jgi:hypothetical protein
MSVPAPDAPVGLRCPLCSQPPYGVLGGGTQAFCGTDDCKVVIWDPTLTMDQTMASMEFIDLSGWAP